MNIISHAKETDKNEILELYRSLLHGPAGWDENYPGAETIDYDLSRDALYIMKNEDKEIIAAISADLDDAVEALTCWSSDLAPGAELSRLAIRKDMQNQGLSKQMMKYAFDELRKANKKSVHILVMKVHAMALHSYETLGFRIVGECNLYNHDYYCMEIEL